MKGLSEKLTEYIVRSGTVSPESYAVYQYGFQIGLEMSSCFVVCFGIAVYLNIIPKFFIFTGVFMLLRTYGGGLHLDSFGACFLCSVLVQTLVMVVSSLYTLPLVSAWVVIVLSDILIWKLAPVECVGRELEKDEKKHCKQMTVKLMTGILLFAGGCTIAGIQKFVSLIAMTTSVVLVSQYIGTIKYKLRRKNNLE